MRDEEYFTIDRAYLVEQAKEAWRIYWAPLRWLLAGKRRPLLLMLVSAILLLAALSGCATTRYAPTHCVTKEQYEQLQKDKPGKIHNQLNGQADHDIKPIAGRLVRVEAWGDGLATILGGCIG